MAVMPDALFQALDKVPHSDRASAYLLGGGSPDPSFRNDPNLDLCDISYLQLVSSVRKKYDIGNLQSAASYDAAVSKFLECNEACNTRSMYVLDEDNLLYMTEVVDYAAQLMADSWQSFSLKFDIKGMFYSGCRFGPGSVMGEAKEFLYSKFTSNWTYQEGASKGTLLCLLKYVLHENNGWASALLSVPSLLLKGVQGCGLFTVEKTREEDRVCAKEPLINALLQQGFGFVLSVFLRVCFGIDLKQQQTANRRLALLGSKYGTFCTIDLTSSSDLIAMLFWSKFSRFAPTLYQWVNTLRSKEIRMQSKGQKPKWIPINMVSTMGNAFTFPLQTLIYTCLVWTAYDQLGIKIQKGKDANFAVNGDDIIVDARAFHLMIRLLQFCGFRPNASKCFSTGGFRESCGGDYFYGHRVRGVYIPSLETPQDCFVAINKLTRFGAETRIDVSPVTRLIAESLDANQIRYIPHFHNDDAGIKTPVEFLEVGSSYTYYQVKPGGVVKVPPYKPSVSMLYCSTPESRRLMGLSKRIKDAERAGDHELELKLLLKYDREKSDRMCNLRYYPFVVMQLAAYRSIRQGRFSVRSFRAPKYEEVKAEVSGFCLRISPQVYDTDDYPLGSAFLTKDAWYRWNAMPGPFIGLPNLDVANVFVGSLIFRARSE